MSRSRRGEQRAQILGRIVLIDTLRANAEDGPDGNPYGLPLGTEFYVCYVESLKPFSKALGVDGGSAGGKGGGGGGGGGGGEGGGLNVNSSSKVVGSSVVDIIAGEQAVSCDCLNDNNRAESSAGLAVPGPGEKA